MTTIIDFSGGARGRVVSAITGMTESQALGFLDQNGQIVTDSQTTADAAQQAAADAQTALAAQFMTQDEGVSTLITDSAAGPQTRAALDTYRTSKARYVDVRDYGARGNGTIDDTQAIKDALAAGAASLMPVMLPGGTYKVTQTLEIPSGVIMRGAGQDPNNGAPTRFDFRGIAADSPAMLMDAKSNIHLSDFYLTGRDAGTAPEISFRGISRRVVLERITVNTKTTGAAVDVASPGGALHSLLVSEFRSITAVGGAHGFNVGNNSTSLAFTSCYANANTTSGYYVAGTYLAFNACAADGNGLYGYLVQGATAVAFMGCGAEHNGRTGWHLSAAQAVSLIGCRTVDSNTLGAAHVASFMNVNDGSDNITVVGCVDTNPHVASTAAVKSFQGTLPARATFLNCDFPAGVAPGFPNRVTVRTLRLEASSIFDGAPLRIPHGAAPPSPVDGDVWTTTGGVFARINGVTHKVTTTAV